MPAPSPASSALRSCGTPLPDVGNGIDLRVSPVVVRLNVFFRACCTNPASPLDSQSGELGSLLHKAQKPCNRLWFKPQLRPSKNARKTFRGWFSSSYVFSVSRARLSE